MMLVPALIALPALIHLAPVSGVLGAAQLESLYGIPIQDPTLLLAMRHRAVMFGVLGLGLVAAMFMPNLQPPTIAATLMSDTAFLVLALGADTHRKMRTVLLADIVSITLLAAAMILVATAT